MNAYLLSTSEQVQQTFSLTVSGPIVCNDNDATLEFMIYFPSESGLQYVLPNTGKYTSIATSFENIDYYIWNSIVLNKNSDETILATCALSVDQQFLIIYQKDVANSYIIASTDPNIAPSEILEYFSEFIDFCDKG